METKHGVADANLRKKLLRRLDELEKLNDWVAETPIRHAVSGYLVDARLAIRDGVDQLEDEHER
jgi:hypothetical protein